MNGTKAKDPGFWPTPISPEIVAQGGLTFGGLCVDRQDIYWSESRPLEGGRYVVVRYAGGRTEDALPAPWSARSFVHEYGGGAFTVLNGTIVFSHGADGGLYRLDEAATEPVPLCTIAGLRFADMEIDQGRNRVISIIEDHRGSKVRNYIAAVPLTGGEPLVLVEGNDFYSNPRINPTGDEIAWLTWNVPNMPWDDTSLYRATFDESGVPRSPRAVAERNHQSLMSPSWSSDGVLYFISDRTNWWNLYADTEGEPAPIVEIEAECARPSWTFGRSSYCFLSNNRMAIAVDKESVATLAVREPDGTLEFLNLPLTDIGGVVSLGSDVVMLAGGPRLSASMVVVDAETGGFEVLRSAVESDVSSNYLSAGEPITFPSGTEMAHAIFYPPFNPELTLPPGVLPPLVVHAHGGPTSSARNYLDLAVQFWTTRGFAYLDVNYRGSSGYGRRYREALYGQWGIVDIEDTLNAARYAAEQRMADGRFMFVTGGSAGGYVALMAVCGHDTFAGCCSYFGVTDLLPFADDTHKFEAHYTDLLLGPLPESTEMYRERSPVRLVDSINVPVLLLQGLEDHVVPPSQAELMRDALLERGVPCEYIPFEGEGHGFRRAPSIIASLEAELAFYRRIISGDAPAGLSH